MTQYTQFRTTPFHISPCGKVKYIGRRRAGAGWKDVDKDVIPYKTGYKEHYCSVSFMMSGKLQRFYVHRMVGEIFIPNPQNKPEINHLNNIHDDNRAENLEWATRGENARHHMRGCNKDSYKSKPYLHRKVINSDGSIFNTLTDAAKVLGLNIPNIVGCLRGRASHCGGKAWSYYTEGVLPPPMPVVLPNGYSMEAYNLYQNILKLQSYEVSLSEQLAQLKISKSRYTRLCTVFTKQREPK